MGRDGLLSCSDHPTACAVATWLGEHPVAAAAAALLAIAAMLGLGVLLGVRSDRRSRGRFDAFVASLGGMVLPGNRARGEASVSGLPVEIEAYRSGGKVTHWWTRFSLPAADGSFELEIRPRDALVTGGSFLAFDDGPFDANILVATNDERRTRLALTPEARRQLCGIAEVDHAARRTFRLRVREGRLVFETPGEAGEEGYDRRLRLALAMGADLASRLRGA